MNKKIAIQGVNGSNHYLVVKRFIEGPSETRSFESFSGLINSVVEGKTDYGIMAIENSIAGSILPNYNLISQNELFITAEYFLDIKHNLVALKNQPVNEIISVKSHRMAFYQCGRFFQEHPEFRLIEDTDTALPAKKIAEGELKGTAAIVPDGTADLLGLQVLHPHIQDHNLNSTRFVKVSKNVSAEKESANKASVRFELAHEPGSLHRILSILQENQISMTKIQSIPVQNSRWEYAFFIDIIFGKNTNIKEVMNEIKIHSHQFQLLGIYKQAQHD